MSPDESKQVLCQGMSDLGVVADASALLRYLALLHQWNQAYNLTAIRTPLDAVTKHVLDALAVIPFMTGHTILDVGSGAGCPGIPLSIALPDRSFVLLDSAGKKVRFLETVKRTLKLDNVEIIQARVEEYAVAQPFDLLISRAFGRLDQWIEWTAPLLAEKGTWMAMKGQVPSEELRRLTYPYCIHHYQIPGLQAARCVVCIKKA